MRESEDKLKEKSLGHVIRKRWKGREMRGEERAVGVEV